VGQLIGKHRVGSNRDSIKLFLGAALVLRKPHYFIPMMEPVPPAVWLLR